MGGAAPRLPGGGPHDGFHPVIREEVAAPEEEIRRILALTGKNTPRTS